MDLEDCFKFNIDLIFFFRRRRRRKFIFKIMNNLSKLFYFNKDEDGYGFFINKYSWFVLNIINVNRKFIFFF